MSDIPPKELLHDMRCQVEYTDVATMPIPLYERMKEAITEAAKEQPVMGEPSKGSYPTPIDGESLGDEAVATASPATHQPVELPYIKDSLYDVAQQLANELVESGENHFEDAFPIIEYALGRMDESGFLRRAPERESSDLHLKWEKLEETGLMNADNILALDFGGCYHKGKVINGKFYIWNPLKMSRHDEIEIEKYAELPDPDDTTSIEDGEPGNAL